MKIKGVKPDEDETDDAVKAKVARTSIITKVSLFVALSIAAYTQSNTLLTSRLKQPFAN